MPDVDLFKIYKISLDYLEGSTVKIVSLHNKSVQLPSRK